MCVTAKLGICLVKQSACAELKLVSAASCFLITSTWVRLMGCAARLQLRLECPSLAVAHSSQDAWIPCHRSKTEPSFSLMLQLS